ncbi:GIY-YIG catalytic domain-containing endonuclease [Acanthocystis turfacea Chlorella virus NE-JV-2]|nr:GIY-YIG catalytic domain-containing endonuclease [Acanthocystis turfacea Chlorella virus NE-JV-2]
MGFIYILTSPSGKSYIGQTIRSIEERFKQHQNPDSECVAISRAIQKYGWKHMKKEWREVHDDELNFYEEMLVALLGTLSPGGYNLREGGGSRGSLCEDTKQKITLSLIGKTRTDETKLKLSESMSGEKHPFYGKAHTDETKRKMSEALSGDKNPFYGKAHTGETKRKMSEVKSGDKHPFYGRTHTEETKKKMSEKHPRSKRVYQYDINGTFLQSFASAADAARSLNKSRSRISECARGDCDSAYGFKWSYTEL